MTPDLLQKMAGIFKDLGSGVPKEEILQKIQESGGLPPVEIYDARESYIEKYRSMLIDRFELTSVSVINAGIAGDTLPSMIARAERDVIRYQPDLILVNGSLNWNDEQMGDAALKAGCPWEELLANRINHPSVEGHEVYAKVLMKLFD